MSLLAVSVVKNSHILIGINFVKLERLSIPNLDLNEEIRKVVILA